MGYGNYRSALKVFAIGSSLMKRIVKKFLFGSRPSAFRLESIGENLTMQNKYFEPFMVTAGGRPL